MDNFYYMRSDKKYDEREETFDDGEGNIYDKVLVGFKIRHFY